ncbi:MAG: hypothetical protein IT306_25310 [Chloroflexi bacterium]|nr:hypothetical protein [Chloroflexota bacterium]
MTGRSRLDGQEVRVLDADGTPLTWAVAGVTGGDGAVRLDEVDAPGVLVQYYFLRGERTVLVELPALPEVTVEGTLETWWRDSERAWQVWIDRPLAKLPAPLSELLEPELVGRS